MEALESRQLLASDGFHLMLDSSGGTTLEIEDNSALDEDPRWAGSSTHSQSISSTSR